MRTARALPLLILAACATTAGRDFDSTKVASIKVGSTKRSDIDTWFGTPYQLTIMAATDKGGVRRYVYAHARRGYTTSDVNGKSLIVDFNSDDTVVDLRYTEQGGPPPPRQ
jgi:outer membrane protein assembly factor BamE (lipoprotein component of BamABCDE complex)